ncbi:glutathione S-transferase [Oceaniglobus trochenteri]|uniref:glutathione S-transferase n=1 Tax=Oceaniglobus trochenteri TaxID=2763260 RepID=UPI001CFF8D7A|nr:glutathione S-transferase [Oceaniglobus trochenteri]
MTLLLLGDRAYSSWSLRGWLLFHRWNLPVTVQNVPFEHRDVAAQLAAYAPARTVPTAVFEDGAVVSESLAIAEELASRHPEAGIWPQAPKARATARTLAAEMHAGFTALRSACPMNLRCAYTTFTPDDAVLADLARLEQIWSHARKTSGASGPWLCGDYSAADAFFAPVAARIAGYGLPVGEEAGAYVTAHLRDPAFRQWRAMALVRGADLPWYARDHDQGRWPGPEPLVATSRDHGPAVNDTCPYSGKPVSHFLTMEGETYGFCNAFCRDKTAVDPAAWPAFMALTPRQVAGLR